MDEAKVAYLCDFKADCAGPGCSCHGGECSHVFDPAHARFGPCEYPQISSRFFLVKGDIPECWWEIGSAQDLEFAAALDEDLLE